MERPRRPEPAAIDITWVSCRGVRSSLPFHTPCLYASIFVAPSSAKGVHGNRRPHRVKTPTDRAGGANPEWDAPLRLYLPVADADVSPGKDKKDTAAGDDGGGDDVLLLRFEIKAEVAVLGDKLAASAAIPVPGLVADGHTRRVSYQLAAPDGKNPNGVISFSYAFHHRNDDDDGHSSSDGEIVSCTPASSTASSVVAHSPPTTPASPRLYPAIDHWPLAPEQILAPTYYPPPPVTRPDAAAVSVVSSRYYPPPPPPAAPAVDPVAAVYPPLPETTTTTSSCIVYPPAAGEAAPAGGMYPMVDLAPVSCYPPAPYGVECGYAAPGWGWDDRCLYG